MKLLKQIVTLVFTSFLLFGFSFSIGIDSQNCDVVNDAFSSGEEVVYKIYYNWGFIWLESGEVTFKAEKDIYKGNPCYRLSGIGNTYPKYDWLMTVRDSFYAWVDSVNLRPYRCIRTEYEGSKYISEDCFFNHSKDKAYAVIKEKKKMPRLDSLSITKCSYDVLTMIYYARNIDFSKYKKNDTIPLTMYLENKIYPTYLRYLGKEVYKAEGIGKFNCVKFRAKLIPGTLFAGGESMTVWVTDDKNKIPLYIEAPILIGSVKAKMIKYRGLRHEVTSMIVGEKK
ncbi:MAG: DUF3108 domain-containing protein [Bacteroidia bacterium]